MDESTPADATAAPGKTESCVEEKLRCMKVHLDDTERKLMEAERRLSEMGVRDGLYVTATPAAVVMHECTICLAPIEKSAVGSCLCHFDHGCLLHAVANGAKACPNCRTPIKTIRRDPEFDALLASAATPGGTPTGCAATGCAGTGSPSEAHESMMRRYTRELRLPPGSHAGITFCGRDGQGPGCVVTRIERNDQAYRCGVRRGDVIVSINGAPSDEPHKATELIDRLTRTSTHEHVALVLLPGLALR